MTDGHSNDAITRFLNESEAPFRAALDSAPAHIEFIGAGSLPSAFATTELATATIAAAGRAAARVASIVSDGEAGQKVVVDRRMASSWFVWTLDPIGWTPASPWDDLAGIYRSSDGWIRLHTNAPHHRQAAVTVLGLAAQTPSRNDVEQAVAAWSGDDLETAIVTANGCAARLRSEAEWLAHPQGAALADEPVAHVSSLPLPASSTAQPSPDPATAQRPLAGVKVLDLTRVLAGPIATRFLAGLGADVLRLDPPDWDEPGVVPEVTRGKRCGRNDLRTEAGRALLGELLTDADILIHGYRGDALERLGLGDTFRRSQAPGLVDVSLNAYGWAGPWTNRRGFDSLVQMSCGIANTGGQIIGGYEPGDDRFRPQPLPTQALDHGTGYLLATAALHGWANRLTDGSGLLAKVSLARTAKMLLDGPRTDPATSLETTEDDWESTIEQTTWGRARRLRPPLQIDGVEFQWDLPATALGTETNLAWSTTVDQATSG